MTKDISTLIFDMGGVLVDLNRNACIEAFRELGFPQADQLLNSYMQHGIFGGLEQGTVSPQQLYDHIRTETGRNTTSQEIDNALNRFLVDLPDYKLDMLLELRKRYRVLMLSNTNVIMFGYIRDTFFRKQGLTVDSYFDHTYLSYEMGTMKPNEDIFTQLLTNEGIRAEQALFIDDGEANIETALRLGFRTYLAAEREDLRPIFGL